MSWYDQVEELGKAQREQDLTSADAMTRALAELWQLMRNAPGEDLELSFRNLSEAALNAAAEPFEDTLAEGRLDWLTGANLDDPALALGAAMRALDYRLAQRRRSLSFPSHGDQFRVAGVDAYVIPRPSSKPVGQPRGPGAGLGRRASPHHRILPTKVGKLPVELVVDTRLLPGLRAESTLACGAALFPEFEVKADPDQPLWIAGKTTLPDEDEVLREQVTGAFQQPLVAAAWPELTMPGERRRLLSNLLREQAASSAVLDGPAIVLAGSWHEPNDGGWKNVARVLDRHGSERMTFEKLRAYVREEAEEGIVSGASIKVLAGPDMLVSFAICLDFCDVDVDIPALALDVDLVLVTSLGNMQTMNGHEQNALKMRTRYGASAFVVQQHYVLGEPVGFVHPRDKDVVTENRAWSTRPLRAEKRIKHEPS